jgi:putative endonuclease
MTHTPPLAVGMTDFTQVRVVRGRQAQARGVDAEACACAALTAQGWTVLARRLRTPAGEIDVVAEKDGLLALVEVKARPSLVDAAFALGPKQQARLLAAAAVVLAEHPDWGPAGMRFDVMLVDAAGQVRRVTDAFRDE